MVLRKIDIKDWGSAVAKQYDIKSLPNLKVYSPEGKLIKSGADPVLLVDPASSTGDSGEMNWIMIGVYVLAGVGVFLFILTKALAPPKRHDVMVGQNKL